MEKKDFLYEGKAKKIFSTEDPDLLIVEYKDDATAFDGQKKASLESKGILNNQISALFFEHLQEAGVQSHYVRMLGERELLVKRLQIVPVEVVVRNIVAGSLVSRIDLDEGTVLPRTVLEFYLKNDKLHDPMINHTHIYALDLATPEEMNKIEELSLKVNEMLQDHLKKVNIVLVDIKLEFGRFGKEIMLGDEISPDTCRFWDASSGEKLDKDRFRRDLGGVTEAYQEVLRRLKK